MKRNESRPRCVVTLVKGSIHQHRTFRQLWQQNSRASRHLGTACATVLGREKRDNNVRADGFSLGSNSGRAA